MKIAKNISRENLTANKEIYQPRIRLSYGYWKQSYSCKQTRMQQSLGPKRKSKLSSMMLILAMAVRMV